MSAALSKACGVSMVTCCEISRALVQGMDISEAMLDVALDRDVEGDLCVGDLGQGLPFRTGTFDGAISISAVQWLCNAVCTLAAISYRAAAICQSNDAEECWRDADVLHGIGRSMLLCVSLRSF